MSEQGNESAPIFEEMAAAEDKAHAIHNPDSDHGVEFEPWAEVIDWDRVMTDAGAGTLVLPAPLVQEVYGTDIPELTAAIRHTEGPEPHVVVMDEGPMLDFDCSVPVPCPPFEETNLNVEAVWWEPVAGEGAWISPEEFRARVAAKQQEEEK